MSPGFYSCLSFLEPHLPHTTHNNRTTLSVHIQHNTYTHRTQTYIYTPHTHTHTSQAHRTHSHTHRYSSHTSHTHKLHRTIHSLHIIHSDKNLMHMKFICTQTTRRSFTHLYLSPTYTREEKFVNVKHQITRLWAKFSREGTRCDEGTCCILS